jgi:hypothetical protein
MIDKQQSIISMFLVEGKGKRFTLNGCGGAARYGYAKRKTIDEIYPPSADESRNR